MPTPANDINVSSSGIVNFSGTAFTSASPGSSTSNGVVTWSGTSANALLSRSTPLIDSTGRLTNTNQPCFLAAVSGDITDVTGDSTTYTIIFNSEIFDQGSNYDTSTGTFTAPVAGNYLFTYNVLITNLTALFTSGICTITAGGSNFELGRINVGVAMDASNQYGFSGSAIINLTASQTAVVKVTVTGSTKTVDINGTVANSTFSGCLLC